MKNTSKFGMLATLVIIICSSQLTAGCSALESKKDCVAEDEEKCEELRINEGGGFQYFALGDATVRASTGFLSASDRLVFEVKASSGLNTCGGTIVSRSYHWNLKTAQIIDGKDTETQRERKTLTSLQYVSIRTKEIVQNRNNNLYAVVARGVPNSKVYFLDSANYQPNGTTAEGQKNVDFWSREVDATYYLVSSITGLNSTCSPLPPQEINEDPDHAEEI